MIKKILITILFLLFASFAQADIILENTGQEKLTVYVYWINHPYGCHEVLGVLKCDFAFAVGDMSPGKRWIVAQGNYWTPGNQFLILWQKPLSSDIVRSQRFEVTDYLIQVYSNQNATGFAFK